jgi:hypothetical protein
VLLTGVSNECGGIMRKSALACNRKSVSSPKKLIASEILRITRLHLRKKSAHLVIIGVKTCTRL